MPLSPEKGSSATNIMPADWAKDVQALVRRHKYNFDAAAKEVGATAKELRMELARQEFGDEAGAPKPKARFDGLRATFATSMVETLKLVEEFRFFMSGSARCPCHATATSRARRIEWPGSC